MHYLKRLLLSAFLIFSSVSLAVEPPSPAEIKQKGVTFGQLVEIQKERQQLLPEYLKRAAASIPAKAGDVVTGAGAFWARGFMRATVGMRSDDPAFKIMKDLFDRVYKQSQPGIWERLIGKNPKAQPMTKAQYEQLIGLIGALQKTLGELDNFIKDTEANRVLPDFNGYANYSDQKATATLHRFFDAWTSNLREALKYYELIFHNINLVKERFNEINGGPDNNVNDLVGRIAETHTNLSQYLEETDTYFAFEKKCDAIRAFIGGKDIAEVVILDRIKRGTAFKDWLGDFEKYGPSFLTHDEAAKVSVPFLRWSLERFNNLTRSNIGDAKVGAQVDAGYRIFFIRLQIEDSKAEDLSYLVQQRQLARNGMKSVLDAYAALAKSICSSTEKCTRPSFKGLFEKLKQVQSWIAENPIEAQIIIEEVNHAYSILAGSNGSLLGEVTNAFGNVLQRRSSSDFLREVLYGDYQPIVDPAKAMPPELIALIHLAPSLPYVAGIVKGATGSGLLARTSAAALSFLPGGAVISTCATAIVGGTAGGIQVWAEKKIAKALTNTAEANAVMSGLLKFAQTGDIRVALQRASVIYLARKGTAWFGNACMEGGWVQAACDVALAAVGPVYGWWTGDFATAGAMVTGFACVKYNAVRNQPSACSRANAMIAQIGRNLDINGEEVSKEAREAAKDEKGAESAYQRLLQTVSDKGQTAATSAVMDVLFSGGAFKYPSGISLLEIMAKKGG